MSPEAPGPRILLAFSADDQTWLRQSKTQVPAFWSGHSLAPQLGDALRVGGRQFMVKGRVWEHDGQGPVLRVLLDGGHAVSDTVFG
jgi:hypothetical protein